MGRSSRSKCDHSGYRAIGRNAFSGCRGLGRWLIDTRSSARGLFDCARAARWPWIAAQMYGGRRRRSKAAMGLEMKITWRLGEEFRGVCFFGGVVVPRYLGRASGLGRTGTNCGGNPGTWWMAGCGQRLWSFCGTRRSALGVNPPQAVRPHTRPPASPGGARPVW